jgi:hypothetical protein
VLTREFQVLKRELKLSAKVVAGAEKQDNRLLYYFVSPCELSVKFSSLSTKRALARASQPRKAELNGHRTYVRTAPSYNRACVRIYGLRPNRAGVRTDFCSVPEWLKSARRHGHVMHHRFWILIVSIFASRLDDVIHL